MIPVSVTLIVWPATVRVVLRELVELLAVKVTVTEPLPLPLVGDTEAHA